MTTFETPPKQRLMRSIRNLLPITVGVLLFGVEFTAPGTGSAQSPGAAPAVAPILDAHQHLRSPAAATNSSDLPPAKIALPPELDAFLQARLKAEMDKSALG